MKLKVVYKGKQLEPNMLKEGLYTCHIQQVNHTYLAVITDELINPDNYANGLYHIHQCGKHKTLIRLYDNQFISFHMKGSKNITTKFKYTCPFCEKDVEGDVLSNIWISGD